MILSSKSSSLSSGMFNDFSWIIREKLIKISSTKGMKCCLNSSNFGHKSIQCVKLGMLLLSPQQGQYVRQFSDTRLLLTYVFTSNLNPHLIRPIQKNPRENCEYLSDRRWINWILINYI